MDSIKVNVTVDGSKIVKSLLDGVNKCEHGDLIYAGIVVLAFSGVCYYIRESKKTELTIAELKMKEESKNENRD